MNKFRALQAIKYLATGAIVLQTTGCDLGAFGNLLQTVFLGITAAGSIAIIQNI